MATTGSNLRTRMSEEDNKLMCDIALKYFKERKVEISNAIKALYPFLETLRDRDLITDEMYKASKKSYKNPLTIPKVVYGVLDNMEEKHHLPLLEILFSKVIMKNYPDLNGICEGFRHEILKKMVCQASVGDESAENRNTQLRIEQGTGGKSYPSLSWLFPDQSNYTESMNLRRSSTSENKTGKRVRTPEASSGFNAKEKLPEAGGSAVRSGADQEGFMDLGNKSALPNPKKRRRARQQPGVSVNFRAEILPVTCGEMRGLLIKRKLERGATRKCIRTEDGNWLTPREFELRGGYEKASNWKTSLTCGGKTLKRLMELGLLRPPPITREIQNKEKKSDKCKICQDEGKLFCCENCQSFFHGDCHLPPVNTKRNGWNCTFCTTEDSSQSLEHYRESEVLVKQMDPGRKLKCEFLLLKVYHHLESNIFPNIPHGNYVTKASQYLGKLRKLDIIKKKLIKENYCKVKDFKEAMDKFFQDPRCEKLHLNQEEFVKNFKEVFAIQETN
ncbi:nuclear body protein SP140-like protein isoform X2 [Artibeus jamaicensis]|uniref:nuclear body protein SP140-like protein isoform X2 n=1 Tax=Artibeus jamaicensis TaxID=9417 RepID=UPI00235AAADB|nr:nuclear body protein SP140-like protein isoform X2 [Artibeus jamaicensis]